MFDSRQDLAPEEVFRLLEELELNQPRSVMKVRRSGEVEIKATVWVECGNASDRDGHTLVGTSSRLGPLSLILVLREPLTVGDVYRVSFDRESLDLDPRYALCRKCAFVTETAFRSTLTFFEPVRDSGA